MSQIPITTYPGMVYPGQYQAPEGPFGQLGRTPMFGGDPGHRYTGPFNVQLPGPMGAVAGAVAPMLLNQLMAGTNRSPYQFLPAQSLYDQMLANQYFAGQQQAMQVASRRDTDQMAATFAGMTRLLTGRDPNAAEQARNRRFAGGIANQMPLLMQFLGPDLIDALHGSRGSATVMAQQVHAALQTGADPLTGQIGFSGASAGMLSQELFERLYGANANPAAMRGLSAGQAGLLFNELNARGALGPTSGSLSFRDRVAAIGEDYRDALARRERAAQFGPVPGSIEREIDIARNRVADEGTIARIAERLPDIVARRDRGEIVTGQQMEEARARVRNTRERILREPNLTQDELKGLDGGEDIMRSGDADRLSRRLKNMAGAVKAMRDIFGDMGRPNAPMREIINGLDQLTQGGLATMSPGDLERVVRRTQALARNTGIGMQGMMALSSQGAAHADRLGLDRSFALSTAHGAAAFGASAQQTLRPDLPAWGVLDAERLTVADQQLRAGAAASPVANQLNAVLRMQDEGLIAPTVAGRAPANEVQAVAQAVRQGQATYTWQGRTRSVSISRDQMQAMLQRDENVSEATFFNVLQDRRGNQEFGQRYNTADTVRQVQRDEIVNNLGGRAIGSSLVGQLDNDRVNGREALRAGGINLDQGQFREMLENVGVSVARGYMEMSPEDIRDPARRQNRFNTLIRQGLSEQLRQRMPNAGHDEIAAATDALIQRMGPRGMERLGSTSWSSLNQAIQADPRYSIYGSAQGLHQLHYRPTHAAAAARRRQAEAEGLTQSALSGLGGDGPVSRFVDAITNARPNTPLREILAEGLGGVDLTAIADTSTTGPIAQLIGLVRENRELDPNKPADFQTMQQNATVLRGLVNGGDDARAAVTTLRQRQQAGMQVNPDLIRALETSAGNGQGIAATLRQAGYINDAQVSTASVRSTAEAGRTAATQLAGLRTPEFRALTAAERASRTKEAQESGSGFVTSALRRSGELLADDRSMEQLGAGGLALIQRSQQQSSRLQEMARAAGDRLGRTVSVGELLSGGTGITTAETAQANTVMGELQASWTEIERRRNFQQMPGTGTGENLTRAARTEQEKKDTKAEADFRSQFTERSGAQAIAADPQARRADANNDGRATVEEQRAADVVDRLAAMAPTTEQRERLRIDSNRQRLIQEVMAGGDRSIALDRGLRAGENLARTALGQGLYGQNRTYDQLTVEERNNAGTLLDQAIAQGRITAPRDVADIRRMQEDRRPLENFGTGVGPDAIAQDALRRVGQFQGQRDGQAPGSGGDKEVKVKITGGNITVNPNGTVNVDVNGTSWLDQIMAAFGAGS